MNTWTSRGACLLALALATGCSDKDGHTVGGRARSLSTVAAPGSSAAGGALRLIRQRDQASGAETSWVVFDLVTDTTEASLRLPDGSEEPMTPAGPTSWTARRDLAQGAAPPAGSYTALWRDADGTRRALTLLAQGDFPAAPQVTAPLDMALLDPAAIDVTWSGVDAASRIDVRVERFDTDELVVERSLPAGATQLSLPALEGGRRFRLTVTAASAAASAAVRWESASTLLFDTVQ